MKRMLVILPAMLLFMSLVGCNNNENAYTSFNLDESITEIDILYDLCGGTTEKWSIQDEDIATLKLWFDNLKCTKSAPPEFSCGAIAYSFSFVSEKTPEFSYINHGNVQYLILEGEYYLVTNPSDPPVTPPNT